MSAEASALQALTASPSPTRPWNCETGRGAIFLAVRYALGVVVSVGNMLVMTWWIGPHSYGVFVTAVGIVAFLAVVARGGIDTYLVRSDSPDARMCGTAATLVLIASLGLTLAAASATGWLIASCSGGSWALAAPESDNRAALARRTFRTILSSLD